MSHSIIEWLIFYWYFRKVLVVTALLTMARRFHSYTLEKDQAHPKTTTIG